MTGSMSQVEEMDTSGSAEVTSSFREIESVPSTDTCKNPQKIEAAKLKKKKLKEKLRKARKQEKILAMKGDRISGRNWKDE